MSTNTQIVRDSFLTQRSWMWLGRVFTAAVLIAIYAAGYLLTRVLNRNGDGQLAVSTGSRMSDGLFAPLIAVEQTLLERSERDAQKILQSAITEARASNRKVLLTVGFDGCLPCRQLEQFLHEQGAIISQHFVVVKVAVDDSMRNGEAVQRQYRAVPGALGKTEYFPWLAILDGNGERIVTSDDGPLGIIGLPQGSPDDRAWFLEMLQTGNPKVRSDQVRELDEAALAYRQLTWSDEPRRSDK